MKKLLLSNVLTSLILSILLSILPGSSLLASEALQTKTPVIRDSILETDITPYLESQDCGTQYQSSQEQLAQVQQELISTQDELAQAESEIQSLIDNCSVSACESILESTQDLLSQTDSILESTQDVLDTTRAEFSATESILESTQDELVGANSQIDTAELLLSGTAIPDASAIDTALATLFSLDPYAGQNPNTPLVDRINDGLTPYLQASLAKLGELNQIVQIAAGNNHTVVLTANGKVYACGANGYGELGIGIDGGYRTTFTAMIGEGESGVVAIAVGGCFNAGGIIAPGGHTLVLKNNGAVYATGLNDYGQLGIGTHDNKNILTRMVGEGVSGATTIAAGGKHSLVLKNNYIAYATGLNNYGQLGQPLFFTEKTELTLMIGTPFIPSAIAAGDLHSIVLAGTGKVYATGANGCGQLGTNDTSDRTSLTEMSGLNNANIIAIAAGGNHTIALNNSGVVYATGANDNGQLGTGDNLNKDELTTMIGEGTSGISSIATGGFYTSSVSGNGHSLALKNSGAVYATGLNISGQLGLGNNDDKNELTAMIGEGISGVTAIAAGTNTNTSGHSVILKNTNSTCTTGANDVGQLGINSTNSTNELTRVVGESKVFYDFN